MKIEGKGGIIIIIISILISFFLGFFVPKLITNYRLNLVQTGYQKGIEDVVSSIEQNGFVNIPLTDETGKKNNLKLVPYGEESKK